MRQTLKAIYSHYLPNADMDFEFRDSGVVKGSNYNPEMKICSMIDNYFQGYETLEDTLGEIEEYLIELGERKGGLTEMEQQWLDAITNEYNRIVNAK